MGEGRVRVRCVPPHARNLLPLMFVDFVPENINCISVLVASSLLFY